MTDGDDHDSMRRLREGNDAGLNELMERWKEPVAMYCYRYTGNFTDAKEIAQETFVKVYQSRYRYRPSKGVAFSTWMFRIATNLCRMRHRWKRRHSEVLCGNQEMAILGEGSQLGNAVDPSVSLDRKALGIALASAILTLPPELRTAFILRELHGWPQPDIAEMQGCSTKAIERRLARARDQLKASLREWWPQP